MDFWTFVRAPLLFSSTANPFWPLDWHVLTSLPETPTKSHRIAGARAKASSAIESRAAPSTPDFQHSRVLARSETWENGTKSMLHTGADAGLPPTGNPFRAGDIVKTNASAGGGHADGMQDAQHNPLQLATVEVEPEFAISVSGKPWGDTNSKFYEAMMNTRSGYYMAMDRLKKVYATQGSAGVQNVLKQPH